MAPRGCCAEAAAAAKAGRLADATAYTWAVAMQCEHKKKGNFAVQHPSLKEKARVEAFDCGEIVSWNPTFPC